MTPTELLALYSGGFRGFIPDPRADAEFEDHLRAKGLYAFAAEAIEDYHLQDVGKGKLSLTFLAAERLYPGCLPGGAQGRGSCVAWSTRNAALVSYCAYLLYGDNTERFAPPKVSDTAIANGVFSTEGIYWWRRTMSIDGWTCSSAADVVIKQCGLLERKAYPEIDLDLTTYSASTEGKWGGLRSLPPETVAEVCKQHLVTNATVVKGYDQARAMIASGYALSSCGSEAFENKRDSWGVCKRNFGDSWAHAMAIQAVDDRPETIAKYGCGLVNVQNSWGSYLTGEDRINGTDQRIPVGSFWARWEDVENRYFVALGPSIGWKAAKLPDWGLEGIL